MLFITFVWDAEANILEHTAKLNVRKLVLLDMDWIFGDFQSLHIDENPGSCFR